MFVLAGINTLGVASGQARPGTADLLGSLHYGRPRFADALPRWAWALTLAAMVLLVALFVWKFAASHDFPYAVQGLLNLVFFLDPLRTAVREKLR